MWDYFLCKILERRELFRPCATVCRQAEEHGHIIGFCEAKTRQSLGESLLLRQIKSDILSGFIFLFNYIFNKTRTRCPCATVCHKDIQIWICRCDWNPPFRHLRWHLPLVGGKAILGSTLEGELASETRLRGGKTYRQTPILWYKVRAMFCLDYTFFLCYNMEKRCYYG